MVDKISDPLCDFKYCFIFLCTDDGGNNYRYTWAPVCGYTGDTDTCKLFFRPCSRGLHDSDFDYTDYGKPDSYGAWDYWLLYSENLRGG